MIRARGKKERLPTELPLLEALLVYSKRLGVFAVVVLFDFLALTVLTLTSHWFGPIKTAAGSFTWTDLALGSNATIIVIQFVFLVLLSAFRIRQLISKRIGGPEAIEVKSWTRLITGIIVSNAVYLLMHHLYLSFGPSAESRFAFLSLNLVVYIIIGVTIIPALGIVFDGGKAVRVRTSTLKPKHNRFLVDMTQEEGQFAQLIPRGTIFAYSCLMVFTWIAIFSK